jgi:DNA-damage-inducible protein D
MENQLAIFEQKPIRQVQHEGETFFSIIDIIQVLMDSTNPSSYWNKVQKTILSDSQLLPFWQKLKLVGQDGRSRPSDCANKEGIFRILMSVPSPKAEPFRLWLAQIGKQHIDEIGDPELGFDRLKDIYTAKGYPKEWIDSRMKSIDIRKQLTDEWQQRGVKEGQEYAILTAEIAKATFGLTPSEHKNVKGLERQNLRDHMTNLELIFTMLGEESTRQYAVEDDAQGFNENHESAQKGGKAAGSALKNYEATTGKKIVSDSNFLKQIKENNEEDNAE